MIQERKVLDQILAIGILAAFLLVLLVFLVSHVPAAEHEAGLELTVENQKVACPLFAQLPGLDLAIHRLK